VGRGRSVFVCSACGYQSPRWLGRCPDCGDWNTLTEEAVAPEPARRPGGGWIGERGPAVAGPAPRPIDLDSVQADAEERTPTGVPEFDRVLGGGLVKGSLVLVGGEPGIGKSTLLLQALLEMEGRGVATLLVSGEESAAQVKMRARRLADGDAGRVRLVGETRVEAVIACLEEQAPAVCVVDSVQTLWSDAVNSAPGSVSQIRETAGQLLRSAKGSGTALVLVGHVTKDNSLAGPRVLEHMVDTVLAFEGDRGQPYRILRAVKNRFGSTNEVGVFQMTGRGLEGVPDPSALFLEDGDARSGSAVVAALEGSRCLLAEVQALVMPTGLAVPRRVTRGVDRNRLAMVVAVLSRRAGLSLGECDIFVNLAGGLTVEDPGADLPVALAIASALRDAPMDPQVAAFGELSLTGQVRYAVQGEKRVQELARRGYVRVLLPRRNLQELSAHGGVPAGVDLQAVTDVRDVVRGLIG
jgi:DNA repair protein RadA/Sms